MRKPATLFEQADFIGSLSRRCNMLDGSVARETLLTLNADDVAELDALADRLYRMAPHEKAIRKIVVGR